MREEDRAGAALGGAASNGWGAAILASFGPEMFEQMDIGVATLDSDGVILFANSALGVFARRAPGEIVGLRLQEIVHPADANRLGSGLHFGDRLPARCGVRLGEGGDWATVLLSFRALEHERARYALFASDISAELEIESQIRGELLDAVDAAIIASDLDGVITEWNKGAERLYEISSEEALGQPIEQFLAGSEERELTEEISNAVQTDGSWSGRIEVKRRDGAVLNAYTRNSLIHGASGEAVGMVSVAFDITAQVLAEREAIHARNYLHAVTDQLVEGIYVVDSDNRLTYMNEAAERLLGYSADDLAGSNLHEVLHSQHPDGSPHPIEECPVTAVREGRIATHVEPEDVFCRADGTLLPISYTAASFETPEGARGTSVVFRDISKEKAERDRARRELEAMSWVGPIRDALSQDSLMLFGQPIFDVGGRRIVQQELLLRMRGRDGEAIAAGRFLPAAERYDMVAEIDRWVIANAIAVAADLGQSIQFNLSAASIQDPATPGLIEAELTRTGLDPGMVVIEVTESGLISEHGVAQRFARRLVADGCVLALDDFGTGYGGFTYLTSLNVSILKIDQSFVRNLLTDDSSRTVVKAVVGLANEFGLTTIAEGVEDAETLEMLGGLGVDQAQGYYLGRPAPLDGLPPDHKFRAGPTGPAR